MTGPITSIPGIAPVDAVRPAAGQRGAGFQDVLAGAIREVEGLGLSATQSVERFLAGEGEELHTAALATQRAELAFDLFLQARNKVVAAYQEIMRMPM